MEQASFRPKIESLVADREFIGEQWLNWLKSQGINYHVRLKDHASCKTAKVIKSGCTTLL